MEIFTKKMGCLLAKFGRLTSTAKLKIFGTSQPLVLNIHRPTFAAIASLGGFFHPDTYATLCIELHYWNDGSSSLYAKLLYIKHECEDNG